MATLFQKSEQEILCDERLERVMGEELHPEDYKCPGIAKGKHQENYSLRRMDAPGYRKTPTGIQRSYYGGYGTAVSPTYYPAIDPLSVLASLAFLAFLIQSLASMFDRSRSIAPTTVSARHFMELKMLALSAQVLRALEKYEENRNGRWIANTKRKVV